MAVLHISAAEGKSFCVSLRGKTIPIFLLARVHRIAHFCTSTHPTKPVAIIGPGSRPVLAAPTEVDPLMGRPVT